MVLTTWNLLNSAAIFEDRGRTSVPFSSVLDLAAIIDIYSLYDEAVLVGRGIETIVERRDLHDSLIDAHFLRVIEDPSDEVVATWTKHLALFMGAGLDTLTEMDHAIDPEEPWYTPLFDHVNKTSYVDEFACNEYTAKLLSGAVERAIIEIGGEPDGFDMFEQRTVTPDDRRAFISHLLHESTSWSRNDTFVLRTFLYLAHADVRNIPFVPDANRLDIVKSATVRADQYRQTLARQLQITLTNAEATSVPNGEIFRDIPPLSSIVFERAGVRRDRIVPEMIALREELAPLRERLRRLEQEMFFGSANSAKDAQAKWRAAMQEVAQNFGPGPSLWSWRGAAKFGEQLGDAVDKPTSFLAWSKAILALPVEVMLRLARRRTVVGLHRLTPDVPAVGTLKLTLQRLFSLG